MAVDELHDLDNPGIALWTIPAHRMKARKAHLVPLPPLAREIITTEIERRARPEFVFAVQIFEALKAVAQRFVESLAGLIDKLDDAAGASLKADPPTPHDLRRSVATGLSRLGIPRDDRLAVWRIPTATSMKFTITTSGCRRNAPHSKCGSDTCER